MRQLLGIAGVAGLLAPAACAIGEVKLENVEVYIPQASEYVTCRSPFVKVDLSALPKCGGPDRGSGHCYDGTKVPVVAGQLSPCDDGSVCVPDNLLTAGGAKLKSCTFSFNGQPGACISTLLKDVDAHKDFFKEDGCAENERCIPCIDPRDGKDTGLCAETGPHESACTGGTGETPTLCCHWRGECIEESAVPADLKSTMIKDTCPGSKVCAPISQIEAKPDRCEVLGAPGVCMDMCFLGSLKGTLRQSTCAGTERCMPCALADTFGGDQKLIGCD